MGSAGFKEWAVVCAAMARGEQSILLRKGGIAEGRAGFAFQHREFFLFPTWFHEQAEKIRGPVRELPLQRTDEIALEVFVHVEVASLITSWETALALEPWHILQSEVVRERFQYDDAPGIHVAFIRAFRIAPPWIVPDRPAYRGCRSWVTLPDAPGSMSLQPVLSEDEHRRRREAFDRLAVAAAT